MNRTKLSVQRPEFTIFAKNQRLVQMSESVTIVKNQPFAQMLVLCNNCKEPTFRTKVGIYIAKPDQIIHFLKKLVNSKSSAKPNSSKSPLHRQHFPNHPTSQSFPNHPASHSWTHIFALSSFLNYPAFSRNE